MLKKSGFRLNPPMQNEPFWLDKYPVIFPPTNLAMTEPNGLLAIGGDLTAEWLLSAYSKGIFPWFSPGEPGLSWTPEPRSVLLINDLKFRRSLRKSTLKLIREKNGIGTLTSLSFSSRKGAPMLCVAIKTVLGLRTRW